MAWVGRNLKHYPVPTPRDIIWFHRWDTFQKTIFWQLPCCPFPPAFFRIACAPHAAAVTCRKFASMPSSRTCKDSKAMTSPGSLGTPKLKAKLSWSKESWIFTCGFRSTAGSSTYGKFHSLGVFIPHGLPPLHLLFKFFFFV